MLVLLTVGYGLVAKHVPAAVEHAASYVIGFLFVFGLLDIVGLARQLVRHGVGRAQETANEAGASGEPGKVAQSGQGRGGPVAR
jgi:hypothetical protein